MKITRGVIRKAQKILVYSPEGVGKTTFASKFPDPLFMDTEDGSTHLDVARLERPTSLSMVGQQLEWIKTNKPCKTLVIDTVDWLELLIIKHVIAISKVDSIEKVGGGFGKGYTEVAENLGILLDRLQDIVDAGIHVVLLCHSEVKRYEDPMELGSYDRFTLKLSKKGGPLVKEWADMVLFANHKVIVVNQDNKGAAKGKNTASGNGTRTMFTQYSPSFDAKNRHGLLKELPFEFESISEHIDANLQVVADIATTEVKVEVPIQSEPTPVAPVTPVTPVVEEPKPVAAVIPQKNEDWTGVPEPLQQLMTSSGVKLTEIMFVVEQKGFISRGTPFANYPAEIIQGLLIAGWDKLYQFILENRSSPVIDINSNDLPF